MFVLLLLICPAMQQEALPYDSVKAIAQALSQTLRQPIRDGFRRETLAKELKLASGDALQITIQYFHGQTARAQMIETHRIVLSNLRAVETICPKSKPPSCYLRLRFEKNPSEDGGFSFEVNQPSGKLVQTLQLGPFTSVQTRQLATSLSAQMRSR